VRSALPRRTRRAPLPRQEFVQPEGARLLWTRTYAPNTASTSPLRDERAPKIGIVPLTGPGIGTGTMERTERHPQCSRTRRLPAERLTGRGLATDPGCSSPPHEYFSRPRSGVNDRDVSSAALRKGSSPTTGEAVRLVALLVVTLGVVTARVASEPSAGGGSLSFRAGGRECERRCGRDRESAYQSVDAGAHAASGRHAGRARAPWRLALSGARAYRKQEGS
jgi:hypothetical protein